MQYLAMSYLARRRLSGGAGGREGPEMNEPIPPCYRHVSLQAQAQVLALYPAKEASNG